MRFFNFSLLFFVVANAYAVDYQLNPASEDIDGVKYYTLTIKHGGVEKSLDVSLEGNANNMQIKKYFTYDCSWGKAEGIRIDMTSLNADGAIFINNYYFFDKNLNNIFSKSYTLFDNKLDYHPFSIDRDVCISVDKGVKKDGRTGKDYIQNYEVITQGPFNLKGVPEVKIKYVVNQGVEFIRESEFSEEVIDKYKNSKDGLAMVETVFFMNIYSKMNVLNLLSWRKGKYKCYKVYAYEYDTKGKLSKNDHVNSDVKLSGCDNDGFKYKDYLSIKNYFSSSYFG